MKIYMIKYNFYKDICFEDTLINNFHHSIKEKIIKIRNKNIKNRYILGRLLAISILANIEKIPIKDIEISIDEYGKPYFKNSKLFFSIAHSGCYIVCVADYNEIGIDIEKMEAFNINKAEIFFNEREMRALNNTAHEDKRELYYRIWTRK